MFSLRSFEFNSLMRHVSQAMTTILDHFGSVVRPALRNYARAEDVLTEAIASGEAKAADDARQAVMLAARQAVDVLHHFADFVLKEPSTLSFSKIEEVRAALTAQCVFLRTATIADDVALLRDVADAFKHHRPDRTSATVVVSTDVVPACRGWGTLRWSEGKWGGAEQIILTMKDGDRRALSSVLQNVFDAWMTLLGQRLPPINQF